MVKIVNGEIVQDNGSGPNSSAAPNPWSSDSRSSGSSRVVPGGGDIARSFENSKKFSHPSLFPPQVLGVHLGAPKSQA